MMAISAPAAILIAVKPVPVWATSIDFPTSVCTPSTLELMILISQWKLYFSQKPFLAAITACMLPVVPA